MNNFQSVRIVNKNPSSGLPNMLQFGCQDAIPGPSRAAVRLIVTPVPQPASVRFRHWLFDSVNDLAQKKLYGRLEDTNPEGVSSSSPRYSARSGRCAPRAGRWHERTSLRAGERSRPARRPKTAQQAIPAASERCSAYSRIHTKAARNARENASSRAASRADRRRPANGEISAGIGQMNHSDAGPSRSTIPQPMTPSAMPNTNSTSR